MDDGKGAAEDELEYLQRGQGLLEPLWKPDFDAGEGEVKVHQGVDEGVEDDKDPDWGGHVSNSGPHAEDGARVVVALQQGGRSALEKDDGGIENLVVLGEVEEVSVEGQTLDVQVLRVGPDVVCGVVVVADAVPEELCPGQGAGLDVLEEDGENLVGDLVDGSGHADEGPDGVDAEEDVMQEDQDLEDAPCCDLERGGLELLEVLRQLFTRVGLLELFDLAVLDHLVEVVHGQKVGGGEDQGDVPVQGDWVDDCAEQGVREVERPGRNRLREVGYAEGVDVGEELPLDQGVEEGRLGRVDAGHGGRVTGCYCRCLFFSV